MKAMLCCERDRCAADCGHPPLQCCVPSQMRSVSTGVHRSNSVTKTTLKRVRCQFYDFHFVSWTLLLTLILFIKPQIVKYA